MDVVQRYEDFEFVEGQRISIRVWNNAFGIGLQYVGNAGVQRRLTFIHALQNVLRLRAMLEQAGRRERLYGRYILLRVFIQWRPQHAIQEPQSIGLDGAQAQRIEEKRCRISLQIAPQ